MYPICGKINKHISEFHRKQELYFHGAESVLRSQQLLSHSGYSPGSLPCSQQPVTVHTTPSDSSKIHFNTILPSMSRSSYWSLSFCVFHENPISIPLRSNMSYMPCPNYCLWSDYSNYFGEEYKLWSTSLWNFLQSSITSPLLGPNILLSTLFSNTFSLCSSINARDQAKLQFCIF
jgi:hypothetical protein